MGWVSLVIALVLFFLSGVGATFIPNPATWGFFFLTLGLLLGNYGLPGWPARTS